ncbi:YciI-like protein [Galbibacter mesophilus]|uniref:YciI-like protein n=1 Tax=Galbibacter mesophilus TaxID=379069 RepID=UPI00191D0DE3|nr:YciI-like protein [Galbibacter mesophilus]MCM5661932.1 YciI-like protein [Galbibacter mesophilus]
MNYFALKYKVAENYLEERAKYRAEHLQLAKDYHEKGILILAGAMENPADEALLIFKCDSEAEVKYFVENDPYVENKLVLDWEIRKWNVVIGNQ